MIAAKTCGSGEYSVVWAGIGVSGDPGGSHQFSAATTPRQQYHQHHQQNHQHHQHPHWYNQSCKNVPTVPTSWCYFFWPVLIFGKYTRKTGENTRKEAKNRAILVLNFLWEKLVGAHFYAFCNYETNLFM